MSYYLYDIEDIYNAIQNLPARERRELWERLQHAFPGALDGTNPAPAEVWDDPLNGFGPMEAYLLQLLWEYGELSERDVLKDLWPDEWSAKPKIENGLRQRLRKLEQRARHKLRVLKSDWILHRPRQRTLELARDR